MTDEIQQHLCFYDAETDTARIEPDPRWTGNGSDSSWMKKSCKPICSTGWPTFVGLYWFGSGQRKACLTNAERELIEINDCTLERATILFGRMLTSKFQR